MKPDELALSFDLPKRNLVGSEGAFGRKSVHHLRSRPSLGSPQDDHRPAWTLRRLLRTGRCLNGLYARDREVKRTGHKLMHDFGIVSLHKVRLVAITREEMVQLFVA